MPRSLADLRAAADAYDFRHTHPALKVGTASDRYAAWLGQVYPEAVWADQVDVRPKKTSKGTFEERLLPVASVADYFQHFDLLEIDFTYYRPLLDADGNEQPTYHQLAQYLEHVPSTARFLLKAPAPFFARQRRKKGDDGTTRFVPNPTYLDVEAYVEQFQNPAVELLGDKLLGVVFEQEYQRKEAAPSEAQFLDELGAFFDEVPPEVQAHLEVRTPGLLTDAYFAWLEASGLGFVYAYWQYLPPLREQWARAGRQFTAQDGTVVTRLLSPPKLSFDDAFAQAYPFDKPVPSIADAPETQAMVLDAVALTFQAERQQATHAMIVNNRAYGNAPELARRIAHRVLDEREKRGEM